MARRRGAAAPLLRILTYNIHGQRDAPAALDRVVRTAAPDVAVVQEGPRRILWCHRRARLAHRWDMVVADGGEPSAGNVLLVAPRVRVHDTRCVLFPLHVGRHLRGAVVARCSVAGVPFLVCGTHLALDQEERCAQVRQLQAVLAAHADVPVIVAGDLNETPERLAWQALVAGRVDAAQGDGTPTFPTRAPEHRIDVVFADPRCEVREYQVVDTPDTRVASDHFPVLVGLALPNSDG